MFYFRSGGDILQQNRTASATFEKAKVNVA